MSYTYTITKDLIIEISNNDIVVIIQEFDPETGEKFTQESAQMWVDKTIEFYNSLEEKNNETKLLICKEEKRKEIAKEMENEKLIGHCMSSIGYEINADKNAFDNIQGVIRLFENKKLEVIGYRFYDDIDRDITPEQAKSIQYDIDKFGLMLYQKKWGLLKLIEKSTLENINDIKWTM